MLLELAIGDAYGAGFEFAPMEKVHQFNDANAYQQHEFGMPRGSYTDDTQMSLAIAELLIGDTEWTRENIADQFVTCFKRDERLGYSQGFHQFLISVNSGSEFIDKINNKSMRNGAAMRSAPLGVIAKIDELTAMCEVQASLTHNTDIGIKSSQAAALAAHYFIYQHGQVEHLTEFVSEFSKYHWNDNWKDGVACCAEETINALLTTLKNADNLKDVLIKSVSFGGDVDTVSSLALAISSSSCLYENNLPDVLFEELENHDYGRDYLSATAHKLMALAK
ncbi:ADP-ribosylglycohydrolase family protein [Alteromonadaceae bacterium M269]|nr:ADP-ribosylglycohydrolase family protein [Alteromonadaceae bacterium M269]